MARDVRLHILCPLHCKPGQPLRAVVKPLSSEDLLVLCPGCIEEGGKLREKVGVEMAREAVAPSVDIPRAQG